MDESALKSLIDGLNKSRAVLDSWLLFWTWLVAIGVALELIFIVWEYIDDKRPWRIALTRGVIPIPTRPSRLKLICELIGIALVVVGIAGELHVDKQSGQIETSLRDANERRVLLLEQEAGNAATSAAIANNAAGEAESKADAAGKEAGQAETKSGNAIGKANQANASASNALALSNGVRQEAHSIENDLGETKKRVEYVHKEAFERILSPRFSEALKGRPTGTVEVRADTKDNDAFMFASQITDALRKAGWIASDPLPISWDRAISELPSPPTELKVQVSGTLCLVAREPVIGPGANTAAGAIWDAVRSAEQTNGDCSTSTDSTLPNDHFVIVVGRRY